MTLFIKQITSNFSSYMAKKLNLTLCTIDMMERECAYQEVVQ